MASIIELYLVIIPIFKPVPAALCPPQEREDPCCTAGRAGRVTTRFGLILDCVVFFFFSSVLVDLLFLLITL